MDSIYKPFLDIKMFHNHYNSSRTPDLKLTPLPETGKLLKGLKIVIPPHSDQFQLLIAMDGNKPMIKPGKKEKLAFLVHCSNPNFENFTDLPERETKTHIYHFVKKQNSKELELGTIPIRPKLFTYQFESNKAELLAVVEDDSRSVVFQDIAFKNKKTFTTHIDLQGHPPGKYTLKFLFNGKKQFREDFYLLNLSRHTKPFGIVDFNLRPNNNFNQLIEYEIRFSKKEVPWTYIVTLAKNYQGYTIDLVDIKTEEQDETSPYPIVQFNEMSGDTDFAEGTVLEYRSFQPGSSEVQPIPLLEAPNKDLQLRIKKQNKVRIVEHLPNPSSKNIKAEVHLKI